METGYGYDGMSIQDHSNGPWRNEPMHTGHHPLDDPEVATFAGHAPNAVHQPQDHMQEVVGHLETEHAMVLRDAHVHTNPTMQDFANMQSELIKSRSTQVVLANAINEMVEYFTAKIHSLTGHMDTRNMQLMVEGGSSYANTHYGGLPMPVDLNGVVAPKKRAARPRKPRKKAEDGASSGNGGQQSSLALIPLRSAPTPSAKKNGKMIYFGRAFLEFAMDHFERITTGWTAHTYAQGRPSKQRAYAAIISMLTFYRRHEISDFDYYFQKACLLKNTDDAHRKYSSWLNKKPSGPFDPLNHGTFYLPNGKLYAPLKQNELQFNDFANIYISCFGSMQGPRGGQTFVLHPTPMPLPPEVIARLQNPEQVAVMDDHPPAHSHTSAALPEYESYDQVDVEDYINNHHNNYASSSMEISDQYDSILRVETSNDGNIDDFRQAVIVRTDPVTPLAKNLLTTPPSSQTSAENTAPSVKNIFKKRKRPVTAAAEEETLSTTATQIIATPLEAEPLAKRSKTRRHLAAEAESVAQVEQVASEIEPTSAASKPVRRTKPKVVAEPTASSADVLSVELSAPAVVPPLAKRPRVSRGQIINPDGSYTPVSYGEDKTIYDNRVMTKAEAYLLQAAAMEQANMTVASSPVAGQIISTATLAVASAPAATKKRRETPVSESSPPTAKKFRATPKRNTTPVE